MLSVQNFGTNEWRYIILELVRIDSVEVVNKLNVISLIHGCIIVVLVHHFSEILCGVLDT